MTSQPFAALSLLSLVVLAGWPEAGSVAAQETAATPSNAVSTVELAQDPESMFEPRQFVSQQGTTLPYRLLKPAGFDPERRYPLVVFLHGAGERGDDNAAQLKHGCGDFCRPAIREKYPCYVIAPQCPEGERWADIDWDADVIRFPEKISNELQAVFELIDAMLADAAVDRRRIYLSGLSMGGYGTWDALARRPHFFAAALPICGGGDPATAASFARVPIRCVHGADDQVVKPEHSRRMITALEEAGGSPQYIEYPGVGHDSWTQTFASDETFDWLFQHRLPPVE